MNYCVHCGRHVARGYTAHTITNGLTICLICTTAQLLRDLTYVSPATKRWRKKRNHAQK